MNDESPERESLAAARNCNGAINCGATRHIHGCFADTGNCDHPSEHGGSLTPAQKVSKSQRERYERERKEKARLREVLHSFAMEIHPTWDAENEDDVFASLRVVDAFLAERGLLDEWGAH